MSTPSIKCVERGLSLSNLLISVQIPLSFSIMVMSKCEQIRLLRNSSAFIFMSCD